MLGKLISYVTRIGLLLIMAALIAGMVGCPGGYDPPPSQNLEIRTWYDLDEVRDNLAGNHTLMNDLDSTTPGYEELAGPTTNGGKGWDPIGTFDCNSRFIVAFEGTLDGQGYEIRDLFIDRPQEQCVGLFGAVSRPFGGSEQSGVIRDINVTNATVIGKEFVGSLVGRCHGTVTNSCSAGNVTGEADVGGLVGIGGTMSNSHFTGSVAGETYVGGLVGRNWGSVTSCSSSSSATGDNRVGGLVGQNTGTVTNSYSTGNVTGSWGVGGLVGWNWYEVPGVVNHSYSTGSVTADPSYSAGGLVGHDQGGTVSYSFWDTETSGKVTSDGGTGKNTTEMQDIITFSGAGWNITAVDLNETNPGYIWNIINNVIYPFLSWQP